jgi:hypothetical protein
VDGIDKADQVFSQALGIKVRWRDDEQGQSSVSTSCTGEKCR